MFKQIYGRVRGLTAGNYPENREEEQFHMNSQGDLLFDQALPELTELTRLSESYVVIGTGVNALTAIPTTVAQLCLLNGEPLTGKHYAISQIGMWTATTITSASTFTMFAQVATTDVALGAVSILPRPLMGGTIYYRGRARARASVTVTADAWHSVGNSLLSENVTTNIMSCYTWNVNGRYLIPPGKLFCISPVVNQGTLSCLTYIIFHEVILGPIG